MRAKFTYVIEETLRRKFSVEADNANEARRIVEQMYDNEDIVLTADDFHDFGIYLDSVDYGENS